MVRAERPLRAAFVVALILAASLAGCTGLMPEAAPEHAHDDAAPAAAEQGGPVFLAAEPAGPTFAPLAARVALDRAWLRPYQPAAATVATAPGADVAWFLEAEGDDVRLTHARGALYASKTSTPQQHHHHAGETDDHADTPEPASPTRRRADVPSLAPGGRPHGLVFGLEGRFLLATPEGAMLNVTVRPDARAGPTDAFLVGPGAGARFVPDELEVPVGARILLWNQAAAPTEVRERAYLARLPAAAEGARFVPIDEGLWRIHAVVRDGARGFGTASAPFLVDFERPAERATIGPLRGRLDQADATLPGVEERALSLSAANPVESLALFFNATSGLPQPSAIRVLVRLDGTTLGEASSLETASLALADLPAGRYDILVRGERGQLVDFELEGVATYRLPTPARLAAAS